MICCRSIPEPSLRSQLQDQGGQHVFNWRRRNEGFEWRDYVRTTILVRRKERRERVKDAQAAAVDNLKEAGRRSAEASVSGAQAVSHGVVAGFSAASRWTVASTKAAIGIAVPAFASALASTATAISRACETTAEALLPRLEPVLAPLRKPGSDLALRIIAPVAGLAALYRAWVFGPDADVIVAATTAAIAAILFVLARFTAPGARKKGSSTNIIDRLGATLVLVPGLDRLTPRQAVLASGAVLALVATGAAAVLAPGTLLPTLSSAPAVVAARVEPTPRTALIEGRATATGGATLRVARATLVLDGVEAPEPDQTCKKADGSTWRCGAAAKAELARLTRGRNISCELTGKSADGVSLARCTTGGEDIAAKLVRSGHVFAEQSFFATYANEQADAEAAKAGLWSGEADRPSDYRAKKWNEAKLQAPNGCPIKGRVASGNRVYLLPWASSYERHRISPAKGERWFCSEEEAQAAGFRASS
jgi:endonuclease YncB( thermonuclease family)